MNNKSGILVVIVAHNELKCVQINLKILLNELQNTGSEIAVVDNCSNDGLQEWLVTQQGISYVIADQIEGYGKILDMIRHEFGIQKDILIMRANYFFPAGSIWELKGVLDLEEKIAAVGPVSNGMAGEQRCIEADTYKKTQNIQNTLTGKEFIKTAYLDPDIMLIKGRTFEFIDRETDIPRTVMRKYERGVLQQGYSFAVVKSAVCFSACETNDEPYQIFDEQTYRQERIQKLLYYFGDIEYKGVNLYKYLEPEILFAINEQNNSMYNVKRRAVQMWCDDEFEYCTEEQATTVPDLMDRLLQKDILIVTLELRKMYHNQFIHTTMETYMSSLDKEQYLDMEFVLNLDEDYLNIPTQNRYPVLATAIPRIYGIKQPDKQELLNFLFREFINPLEVVLNRRLEAELVRACFFKASYVLQERDGFIKFYNEVIDKVKPRVIIYSHGQDRFLTYLRDTAMKLGIPTIEIAHGVTVSGAYHKQLVYADYLITYSKIVANKNLLAGNDKVFPVGKPGVYKAYNSVSNKNVKIIITFISSLEKEIFNYAKNLAEKLDEQKYCVIYKMHSAEVWDENEIQEIQRELGNFRFAPKNQDIRETVNMSDIVVGIRSSGILDAMVFPMVKVITIKDREEITAPGNIEEILQEVVDCKEIVKVDDEIQLYHEVLSYKRNNKYRNVPNCFWMNNAEIKFRRLIDDYISANC